MNDETPGPRLGWLLGLAIAARTVWRTLRSSKHPADPPLERGGDPAAALAADDRSANDDPSQRIVPADPRSELLVATLLLLAAACAGAFLTFYVVLETDTQLLGLAMGAALALLAAAAIVAGKMVVPQETSVEERDALLEEPRAQEVVEIIEAGGEGVSRRVLLTGAGGLAGAAVVAAAAAPLASLGPPAHSEHASPWKRGTALVDESGRAYAAREIQIGSFYTALPQAESPESLGAGVLVVRLPLEMIRLPRSRRAWAPQGIMAFSKICTHAGCAISLYRYPTYEPTSTPPAFTCPCHYSTFTPGDGGQVIFGPAGRALPQLPLMVDAGGNLRAAGEFDEDVGPSWWAVRRT